MTVVTGDEASEVAYSVARLLVLAVAVVALGAFLLGRYL